ncbi:Transcriptional regulatory protein YpdB [Paraconexibacter sp. AEG42_29]|uniref:Transcriptional regulatory protein YpdB n=1 Tax=Paraconexibacter sp. AEG42_29 TaxID=2997339 RepID=A0AAU7AQX1_9ACTN
MTLRVLAVDDERPALEDLGRMLGQSRRVDSVELVGSARDALIRVGEARFDALFLDVRMPAMDGVELARVLTRFADPPALVFVSAYETAAVQAFELHAVDYLMKPVSRRRVEEALERVAGAAAAPPAGAAPATGLTETADDVVLVDAPRGGTRLLPRASILYGQAYGDYVRIVSTEGRFLMRTTLSDLERRWGPHGFARVHRGYLANLRRAVELHPLMNGTATLTFADGHGVPISRRQVAELRRRLRA